MRAAAAAVAAAAALVLTAGAGAQSPTLFATVGPGFTISLADAAGSPVKHLDPGAYTIRVDDRSDLHSFHLNGPGVDQATAIEETGTFTWTVTFSDGTYRFRCDAHPTTMFGSFTVGAVAAPPPPPTTPVPGPAPKRKPVALAAAVGPGKTIALVRGRARLVSVKAGPVVLTVHDRSARDNFRLSGPGVNRATSKAGRGTFTWRLTLKRGLYTYRSDATPALRRTFRAV